MSDLRAEHAVALQFLMTEELYLVDPVGVISAAKGESIPQPEAISAPVQPDTSTESPTFDYLGENNKYFAILVNYPSQQQFMAQKELEALQSILGAKKMDLKDIALVNLNKYPSATFSQLKAFLASNRAVLFGVNLQQLQLPSFPLNQVAEHDGVKLLPTFAFGEMMADVEKKKAFWNMMKGF